MNKKEDPRTQKIEIRVTPEEKKKCISLAKSAQMNLSTYLRERLKDDNVIFIEKEVVLPEGESDKTKVFSQERLLYGLANNLNQLTKLSHQDKKIHSEIHELVLEIKDILLLKY